MRPYFLLTEEDKRNFKDYCYDFANVRVNDLGSTLKYWDKNNRKLCKFLGNSLTVKFPIEWEVEEEYFYKQLKNIYYPLNIHTKFQREYWSPYVDDGDFTNAVGEYVLFNNKISLKNVKSICDLMSYQNVYNGYVDKEYVFSYKNKKELKIPKGTKIMRAMRKVLEYLDFPDMNIFNEWRDEISLLKTDKGIAANLVFSINPIDYLTMSDNDCNWTSCFSFMNDGGYSSSPIQLMNSNMAVVCYIESPSNKYMHYGSHISNKAWRTILYIHKDIMLVGKHYHFYSDSLNNIVIEKALELAEKNLGWKYEYKYQEYNDVVNIRNNFYAKDIMKRINEGHHIYTYSNNSMYNDIIESKVRKYTCCRNYVNKNIYLNLSGPLTCLSCGETIKDGKYSYDDIDSSIKLCYNCNSNENYCSYCSIIDTVHKPKIVKVLYSGGACEETTLCGDCLKNVYMYDKNNGVYVNQNIVKFLKDNRPYFIYIEDDKVDELRDALEDVKTSSYFYTYNYNQPQQHYEDLDRVLSEVGAKVFRPYYNINYMYNHYKEEIYDYVEQDIEKYGIINFIKIDDIDSKYPELFNLDLVHIEEVD